jgi:hypothetical protein
MRAPNKQDFEEASRLATSLLARTQDGKIEWFVNDQNEFGFTTPKEITFLVSSSSEGLGFKMEDGGGHQLISVFTDPNKEFWEMAEGENDLFRVLPDLYDVARRSALKVDEKVTEIREYLNSL